MAKHDAPSAVADQWLGLGLRTVSLPKDEFDSVTNTGPALWRISITARAGGLPSGTPRQSAAAEPSVAVPAEPPPVSSSKPTGGRRPDPARSILGLPILSCRDPYYNLWVLLVNDLDWTWACFADLAAGFVFAVELLLGFHTSYLASNAGSTERCVAGVRWCAVLRAVRLLLAGPHQHRYLGHADCAAAGAPGGRGAHGQELLDLPVHPHHPHGTLCLRAAPAVQADHRLRRRLTHTRPPRCRCAWLTRSTSPTRLSSCCTSTLCLWNFIAIKEGLEGTWLNPIAALVRRYSADGASPLTAEELAGVPAGERYVLGLYFSAVTIATLGYGDIVPVNVAEWLVDCLLIACGVLVFGLAMGSLAEAVASSSKEARQAQLYREKMEGVDAWLHSASVPRNLKHKIRAFYADVWLRHAAARSNVQQQFLEAAARAAPGGGMGG
ncbi:hypothetical protein ABPG77_009195 [Micractinium sp. CCAP 211/92]